jgi:hypothetical protein
MVLMDKSEKQKYRTAKTAPKSNWEITQWISSPLISSPVFLILSKKWPLKYRIDSEKTVSADNKLTN